mgnify:CR=1 FL=1
MSVARPNANGNLFEIKTVQSGAFRTLIEALKEILTEANLEFDSKGIKVMDVDESHTVLVYLRLDAERFETFYCPAKHVLGVNMIYFFKLIKTMGNNDNLTLYLPASNPNKLGIRMENSEKSTVTNYFLKLFDTDVEDIQIPNLNFTNVVQLPSTDLQKICRDMNALGEKLDVEGFLALDEKKYQELPDDKVLQLHRNGLIAMIEMHRLSLAHMNRLAGKYAA